jgi:uncharacterized membrane protein
MAEIKLKVHLSKLDKCIEILAGLVLVTLWILVYINYNGLPNLIPTHFNLSGQADKWSSKSNIALLPVVATVLYFGLTFLNRYPHKFNYLNKITEYNALKQYTYATRLIRFIKCAIVIIFTVITKHTINVANGMLLGKPIILLIIIYFLIGAPLIYYLLVAFKVAKK